MLKIEKTHAYNFLSLFLFFLLVACGNFSGKTDELPSYPPTPIVSGEAAVAFINTVNSPKDLNSSISIERSLPSSTGNTNNLNFWVYNLSDESISFKNQGFDMVLYRYDVREKKWYPVALPYQPASEIKTLPAHLETWDFAISNTWHISDAEFKTLVYQDYRLYIEGVGDITNKVYGAYLDFSIVP